MSDGATSYAIPVAAGSDVIIEGRFPLSESEWSQFMAVLNAMKPGLVAKTATQAPVGTTPGACVGRLDGR